MDKNFSKYSHPSNIIVVSSTFTGDNIKTLQYYNNLQQAINDAPINSTVISYDNRAKYTARDTVTVIFINDIQYALSPADFVNQIVYSDGTNFMGLSYPLVWEGTILQDSNTAPTLVTTHRNDFGIQLHASTPFTRATNGRYSIKFASAISTKTSNMVIETMPLYATYPNTSLGILIGDIVGNSTSQIFFGTMLADGSGYDDDLIDTNTGQVLRVTVNPN